MYFGKSTRALKYKETLSDGSNVFYLKESLEPDQRYYWRVDAELSPNEIYQGDAWNFNVDAFIVDNLDQK